MLYQPVTSRLPNFKSRLREGVCIYHDGGGVYKLFTDENVVSAKHFRSFEEKFPGTGLIRPGVAKIENGQPSWTDEEFGL